MSSIPQGKQYIKFADDDLQKWIGHIPGMGDMEDVKNMGLAVLVLCCLVVALVSMVLCGRKVKKACRSSL